MALRMNLSQLPTIVLTLYALSPVGSAQSGFIGAVGPDVTFTADADSFTYFSQAVAIAAVGQDPVPFRFVPVLLNNGPNFVVVSPSTGVTPALVNIALNPDVVPYLPSGRYFMFAEFGSPSQSCPPCPGAQVTLRLSHKPAPNVTAVVSIDGQQPDISPGELVSILGTNLSTPPIKAKYDSSGMYPTSLGNTSVTINGVLAPILYASTGRIDLVVPYEVSGQKAANILVTHDLAPAPEVTARIVETSPVICVGSASCSDEGGILNAASDGTVRANSVENPAPKGSAITIFATGAGLWKRIMPSGSLVLDTFGPVATVSVSIGDQPASILYAGSAPFKVSGVLQVNAVVPVTAASGPQQLVLTVDNTDNSKQNTFVVVQ